MMSAPSYSIPASPSWYCSRVLDISNDGLLVFGAKRSLYIVDTHCSPPRVISQVQAHQDRVVGVSLCRDEQAELRCASVGEDSKTRIWNFNTKLMIGEHAEHQHRPVAVHWSKLDLSLVASADEKGYVVVWNVESGSQRRFCPEHAPITTIEWSPYQPNTLAIGYKSGSICIVDTSRNFTVIERLRGHEDEVQCVSWCPVPGEEIRAAQYDDPDDPFSDTPSGGYGTGCLLASSSRDRTLRIWSLSQGKAISVLKLPNNLGSKQERYDDRFRSRAWVSFCWIPNRPRQLLSTGNSAGEILLWDLCQQSRKWQLLAAGPHSKGHHRVAFNIAVGGEYENTACSISMDRQIVTWDLSQLQAQHSMPTCGGFVYSISSSPVHPGRMALGVGDNMLRVWNYSNPGNPYDHTAYWQGIKAKITSVAWHPEKEALLAFGTDEGRVGIYDTLSAKQPIISRSYHKNIINRVTWGPDCVSKFGSGAAYMLYSVGDGHVLIHRPNKADDEARNLNSLLNTVNNRQYNTPYTEMSWKWDFSVFALGVDDGGVEIYTVDNLILLASIKVHNKTVNACRWHPSYTAELSEPSGCQDWLATATNDGISVVDLTKVVSAVPVGSVPVISEALYVLAGHTEKVTDIAWSSHTEARLASTSNDGTGQVWDVRQSQGIGSYRGHCGRVLCVVWSDVDPDVVYTGGEDFALHAWRPSQQTDQTPPKGRERKRKKKKASQSQEDRSKADPGASGDPQPGSTSPVSYDALKALLENKRKVLLQGTNTDEPNQSKVTAIKSDVIEHKHTEDKPAPADVKMADCEPAQLSSERDQFDMTSAVEDDSSAKFAEAMKTSGKKWKTRSLLPLFSTRENQGKVQNQNDCCLLADIMYEGGDCRSGETHLGESEFHLGLHTGGAALNLLLDKECSHHATTGNVEQELCLEMWRANPGSLLRRAAQQGKLTDWHCSMAVMVSHVLWEELCAAYAAQLEKTGFYHKAVTYLLSLHKIQEAVDMLVRNRLLRDAVCLARARLHPHDPLIQEITLKWAASLARDGNHEHAAKCYLAAKQPLEAARQLMKRSDLSALRAATYVTLQAKEMPACTAYGTSYLYQCMLHNDWKSAVEVLHWHPSFQLFSLRVCVHELLSAQLVAMGVYAPSVETPFIHSLYSKGQEKCQLPDCILPGVSESALLPWTPWLLDGDVFVHAVIKQWLGEYDMDINKDKLEELHQHMQALWEAKQHSINTTQVVLSVSVEVSLGVLSLLRGRLEDAAHWWSVAMATCHNSPHPGLLQALCRLLLPQGVSGLHQLQQEVTVIRLSVVGDSTGTGPTHLSTDRPDDAKQQGVECISTVNPCCTAVDNLSAYYSRAVLDHLMQVSQASGQLLQQLKVTEHSITSTTQSPNDNTADKSDPEKVSDTQDTAKVDQLAHELNVLELKSAGQAASTNVSTLTGSLDQTAHDSSPEQIEIFAYDKPIQLDHVLSDDDTRRTVYNVTSKGNLTRESFKVKDGISSSGLQHQGSKLSDVDISLLSRGLLWDCQARYVLLQAKSRRIQRTIATLNTAQAQSAGPPTSLSTPPNTMRSAARSSSGDYLPDNSPCTDSKESIHLSRKSPACSPSKVTLGKRSASHSTRIEKKLPEDEKQSSTESSVEKASTDNPIKTSLCESETSTDECHGHQPYFCCCFSKEDHESCDLSVEELNSALETTQKELQDITCMLTSCPFPESVQSCVDLCLLCEQTKADSKLTSRIASWGVKYSLDKQHVDKFKLYLV